MVLSIVLLTDGAFSDDGTFHPLATWDGEAVMKLFRERLLARLVERHAVSEELAQRLLAWRHPGFSAFIGEAIPFEDKKAIEGVACYMVRARVALKKLIYLDGQQAVLYRSKMNPSLGRCLLCQPGEVLSAGEGGVDAARRASPRDESMFTELGEAHQ